MCKLLKNSKSLRLKEDLKIQNLYKKPFFGSDLVLPFCGQLWLVVELWLLFNSQRVLHSWAYATLSCTLSTRLEAWTSSLAWQGHYRFLQETYNDQRKAFMEVPEPWAWEVLRTFVEKTRQQRGWHKALSLELWEVPWAETALGSAPKGGRSYYE